MYQNDGWSVTYVLYMRAWYQVKQILENSIKFHTFLLLYGDYRDQLEAPWTNNTVTQQEKNIPLQKPSLLARLLSIVSYETIIFRINNNEIPLPKTNPSANNTSYESIIQPNI